MTFPILKFFKKKEVEAKEEENIYPENAFVIISKEKVDETLSEYNFTSEFGLKSFYDCTSKYNIGDYFIGNLEIYEQL